MKMLSFAKTDTGIVRKENQDAYGINAAKDFFIVCDGMGGGAAGDFASKYAVDVMLKSYETLDDAQIISVVGEKFKDSDAKIMRPIAAVMLANRALHNLTLKFPKLAGMGTTVVAAKYEKETSLLHIYHCGDSRLYRIRAGIIELMTKDHSKVNELIDEGKMREEEVKSAEMQSMITRALGTGASVKVDYKAVPVKNGDHYIMCSDGLNGEIEDAIIKGIVDIHRGNLQSISNELILAANNAGGRDNTTVLSLKSEDDSFPYSLPDYYADRPITISDEEASQGSAEDKLLSKFSQLFTVPVPKSAKEAPLFSNPLFMAAIIVFVGLASFFIISYLNKDKGKDFQELVGNVSGIKLDIRTTGAERTGMIMSAKDKVARLELLRETFKNAQEYTVPLSNVQISIEEKEGPNKFVGISSTEPLEIRLPKGEYVMNLSYSGYKILDGNYYLVNSLNMSFEYSGDLVPETVIMFPEKSGE
jgi:protein phosphatase